MERGCVWATGEKGEKEWAERAGVGWTAAWAGQRGREEGSRTGPGI